MKKIGFCILLFLMLCGIIPLKGQMVYADGTSSGMDAVLVLDLSGSMKKTDPNKVSLEGAKLFVDMMESSGSRAGFVAFSDKIEQVYNLSTISSIDDKKNIKNAIDALPYAGDTDIGAAALQAVQMLKDASDVGNKKMVLLFTDGETDLPKGTPSEAEAEAASLEQAKNAIAEAGTAGIPIYTIGLNANGEVDTDLITDMAASTSGTNNIVSSASELPTIFNDIFADFVESEINDLGMITITDTNTFEEKAFNIPNGSVLEANIVMITGGSGALQEVELVAPDGTSLTPDGKTMILSTSSNYNILKMIGPSAGDWLLRIKGDQGCQIQVNLLFNYDVELQANAVPNDAGDALKVTAILTKNGSPVNDDALYGQMTTVANVVLDDGTTNSYPMTLDNNNFICEVPLSSGQAMTIVAHTEGANMYRDSEPITYTPSIAAPVTILEEKGVLPSPIEVKGFIVDFAKESLDLNDYWSTTDSSEISYSVTEANTAVIKAQVKGSKLSLKGVKKGTTQITVNATDSQGNMLSQDAEVIVSGAFGSIIPLLIIVAVLILLLVLILLKVLRGSKKLEGFIHYSISPDGISYGREETISLGFMGKEEKLGNIVTDPELMGMEMQKIIIAGSKNGIDISNKSKSCDLKDQFGASKKKLTLIDESSCTIECVDADGSMAYISVRYTMEDIY